MKKKYSVFFIADIIILIFLLLASSTDIFVNEKEGEVYNICVFTDCYKDGHIDNFRLGVDKASSAYNIDLNFIYLNEYEKINEKLNMVTREIENGCQGVLLACGDDRTEEEILDTISKSSIPVVLYNGTSENTAAKGTVGPDLNEEAELIFSNIKENLPINERIYIFEYENSSEYTKNLHVFIEQKLIESGFGFEKITVEYKDDIHSEMDKIVRHNLGSIVSADSMALENIGEECDYYNYDVFVCGAGWSGTIRNYIEKDIIKFTVAHTAYEAGYSAMGKIICNIENRAYDKINEINVKSVVVNNENLYSDEIEPIIFPYS